MLLAIEVVGRDAPRNVNDRVERLAPWLAAGVALATLAAALAWNTWAAGGADSYGYVSQAHLFASGRVSSFEPLALEAPPEAAWTFTPLGFKPGLRPTVVPFYPPGLSVVMAVARRLPATARSTWWFRCSARSRCG